MSPNPAQATVASGITCHILYLPGLVREQALFLLSLLEHSPCRFHLHGNGLGREEADFLRQLAAGHERLTFSVVSGEGEILIHGTAVQRIWREHHHPGARLFAMLDSDVLATGPWLQELVRLASTHAGVFAGGSSWRDPDGSIWHGDPAHPIYGRQVSTSHGLVIGGGHLAIYHASVLNRMEQLGHLEFHRSRWDDLPAAEQRAYTKLGVRAPFYDSCKLLNLRLHLQGYELARHDPDHLIHLEGMSGVHLIATGRRERPEGQNTPGHALRYAMAQHWVECLRAAAAGRALPKPPATKSPLVPQAAQRARRIEQALEEVENRYGRLLTPSSRTIVP